MTGSSCRISEAHVRKVMCMAKARFARGSTLAIWFLGLAILVAVTAQTSRLAASGRQ